MTIEKLTLTNEVRLVDTVLCTVYRGVTGDGQTIEVLVASFSVQRTPTPEIRRPSKEPGSTLGVIAQVMEETVLPLLRPRSLVMIAQAQCGCLVAVTAATPAEKLEELNRHAQSFVAIGNSGGRASMRMAIAERQLTIEPMLDRSKSTIAN